MPDQVPPGPVTYLSERPFLKSECSDMAGVLPGLSSGSGSPNSFTAFLVVVGVIVTFFVFVGGGGFIYMYRSRILVT